MQQSVEVQKRQEVHSATREREQQGGEEVEGGKRK
jgi:hypothetical protein